MPFDPQSSHSTFRDDVRTYQVLSEARSWLANIRPLARSASPNSCAARRGLVDQINALRSELRVVRNSTDDSLSGKLDLSSPGPLSTPNPFSPAASHFSPDLTPNQFFEPSTPPRFHEPFTPPRFSQYSTPVNPSIHTPSVVQSPCTPVQEHASGDAQEMQDPEATATEDDDKLTSSELAQERVDAILVHFEHDHILPADAFFSSPPLLLVRQNSDLMRSSRMQLSLACAAAIRPTLEISRGDVQIDVPTIWSMKSVVSAIEKQKDLMERLVKQDEWIIELGSAIRTHNWYADTVKNLESLRFANQWSSIRGPGSTKIKRDYYLSLYASLKEVPSNVPLKRIPELLKDDFLAWKRIQLKGVGCRERFRKLYNCFGAAVFIDPFWKVDDLMDRRSRTFKRVLDVLAAEVLSVADEDDDASYVNRLSENHDSTLLVLSKLLGQTAGSEIRDYVVDFIENNPPSFSLDDDEVDDD
ncbi:hypothetical protein EIP91_005004 [Steccherinum ochraceum]|uniref:Uncharacterized protein n=1 Tax=Steccherinum ochraceum TaxID=92696 RepID=A0A4R0RG45_9APHY|nr:hypothetical protein EIP91_005004 [Steccherinum ochraceum]